MAKLSWLGVAEVSEGLEGVAFGYELIGDFVPEERGPLWSAGI
jgi:hypothetical protein